MKKNTNQFNESHVDRMNYGGAKFCRFALFPLMLFMLLFVPTRMVAQTDPRCALFNSLDGITDVTITDNGSYPWQMMDLKAEGMTDISFEIPEGSTGLMSSNYNVEGSTSETVVNFKVEKSIFLTFKHLVSSESYSDKATITIDNKKFEEISGMRQIEIKESLSAGEHTLKLSYQKDYSGNNNADRTFIYDLKTATSISDNNYIAEYNAKNTTLTFKKVIDANISDIGNNSVIVEKYNNVGEICKALGNVTIKNIVFEESFKTYAPTSLKEFFYNCISLETISGLEYLNTANITDMSSMFWNCSNLKSLDFTKFDTKNVSSMYFMFYGCSNLTSLNLTNFNTKNVKNMNGMFGDCTHLTLLDITNFNTAKVTNMGNMFLGCSNLTSLDLTNFNTAKVTEMYNMFYGCSALTTIYASDKFDTDNVKYGLDMFTDCQSLKDYSDSKTDNTYANYVDGYFTKLVGKNGDEKIGATGETLATDNLVLDDNKDFVAYEPFAAKAASYSRPVKEGTTWGTLCLPFAIALSQETECKFYRLTGIDNECITLESCEGAEIPAGTPVLFKMNEGEQTLSISAQDASIVTEPKAGTNTDVNLVGSFTKIGGKDNQGLADTDYIIGKDKFWRVSDLNDGKGVGIKPMRAYIHPTTASQARAAMLSIGKGDGTTAIDNLNAISNDANAEYYDANGRRTNGLQKGLNIVKRGSKTYKIMVK